MPQIGSISPHFTGSLRNKKRESSHHSDADSIQRPQAFELSPRPTRPPRPLEHLLNLKSKGEPSSRTLKLEVWPVETAFTSWNVCFFLPEAHWMSLISIHLSKQVRFVYLDHLGRRKPWLELIFGPRLGELCDIGTDIWCSSAFSIVSQRPHPVSFDTDCLCDCILRMFSTITIILWVWRCLGDR